jgi:hypothetical protein
LDYPDIEMEDIPAEAVEADMDSLVGRMVVVAEVEHHMVVELVAYNQVDHKVLVEEDKQEHRMVEEMVHHKYLQEEHHMDLQEEHHMEQVDRKLVVHTELVAVHKQEPHKGLRVLVE